MFLFTVGESALHVVISPYLSEDFGLGPAAIGAVVAVFAVASFLARLPVGAVYRPERARRMLLVGGGLSAAAFLAVPLASSVLPFAALMAVDGFGYSIATTTQLAALVAIRPRDVTTASAMGWYSGFQGLGHTAAGILGGLLADTVGFRASFLALALLPALATAVMVRALPRRATDAPAEAAVAPDGGSGATRLAPGPGQESVGERLRHGARRTWRQLRATPAVVWAGVLVMVYINFINGVLTAFHPVLVLAAGLSLTQVGALSSARSLASSTVRLSSGALFARSGGSRLGTPLVVLGAAATFLVPSVAGRFWLQVPLFLAVGLSRGLLRVTGTAQAFDAAPDAGGRRHGLTAALLHGGLDLGNLAGPPVAGVVAQLFGLATMFRVVPVALLAAYAALQLAARRSARRSARAGVAP